MPIDGVYALQLRREQQQRERERLELPPGTAVVTDGNGDRRVNMPNGVTFFVDLGDPLPPGCFLPANAK